MKFDEINLKPELQKAFKKMGFTDLTPIQEKTLPLVMDGKDILGIAQTGSGKTSACAVPVVQRVDDTKNTLQALILVPTRELALQYEEEVSRVAKFSKVKAFAVCGGMDMSPQLAKLKDGVHILVATPGRLIDMLYNTDLKLSDVATVVLDEADEMLKMGFVEDVDFIMSCLVHKHQTLLFSATMPKEIERLTKAILHEPVTVRLTTGEKRMPTSLEHFFKKVHWKERLNDLFQYLETEQVGQAILFVNSRDKVTELSSALNKKFDSVECIHGGLEQIKRSNIFNKFKSKKIKFMVATDVAGRGLDFDHVTHVINYDFPFNLESYTHRTGRAGRMGRKGVALTYVGNRDLFEVKKLEDKLQLDAKWLGVQPDLSKAKKQSGAFQGGKKGVYKKHRSKSAR